MNLKRLLSISFGHFAIDVLNASIAMILTAVSGVFDLTVSQIGLAAMIYTFSAALTQPFFGLLADRLRGRWLGAVGLLWTMIFFAAAPFMPTYVLMVVCLCIGALGSGAFHPVGVINATASGGRYPTTATSIFFVLGQSGLALGPVLSGILLQTMGLRGLPYMSVLMIPAVVFMFVYLREPIVDDEADAEPVAPAKQAKDRAAAPHTTHPGVSVLTAFGLVIILKSGTMQTYITLFPKYFDNLGYEPAMYGTMIGVFSFAAAIGTFIGGYLGDRFNRRFIIFLSMVLSVPFSLLLLNGEGWAFFVAACFAGALFNVPHSILMIMAQRFLPKRKGLIGGAVLGLMFASGASVAWLASWFADFYGLYVVLTVLAYVPIGASIFALLLPSTRTSVPLPQPQTIASKPVKPAGAD